MSHQDEQVRKATEAEIISVLDRAHQLYDESSDLTLGVEEEFAICDPDSLDLVQRFDEVRAVAEQAGLGTALSSELIASEIEFRTDKADDFAGVAQQVVRLREQAAEVARGAGVTLACSGTHPWADYRDQTIVDSEYYHRLVQQLQYVARRNNTFGLHVHLGVRGADRAIAVCDALRTYVPMLLGLSASSPFLEGCDTGLDSARTVTFTNVFPRSRSGVPPRFGTFEAFSQQVRAFARSGSLLSSGQLWWSVRPHIHYGTIEIRAFDGQPDVASTLALTGLTVGLVADLLDRHDAGELPEAPAHSNFLDENLWRAVRWGTDAELLTIPAGEGIPDGSTRPLRDLAEETIARARAAGERRQLGIDGALDQLAVRLETVGNSAREQRSIRSESGDERVAFAHVSQQTMASHLSDAVAGIMSAR